MSAASFRIACLILLVIVCVIASPTIVIIPTKESGLVETLTLLRVSILENQKSPSTANSADTTRVQDQEQDYQKASPNQRRQDTDRLAGHESSVNNENTLDLEVEDQFDNVTCFEIIRRPQLEFNIEKGAKALFNLGLFSSKLEYESLLDPDTNSVSMGCGGALLHYLNSIQDFETYGQKESITSISLFSLSKFMNISFDTFYSLCIFENNRKSPSLFQLLNKTKTSQGKSLFRSWLLAPLQDIDEIKQRQEMVGIFVDARNRPFLNDLRKFMNQVPNIPLLVNRLRSKSIVSDWNGLINFTCAAINMAHLIERMTETNVLFASLLEREMVERIQEIHNLLTVKLDMKESAQENRIVINKGIDLELDELKRTFYGLSDLLSQVGARMTLPETITTFTVVYFPQIGFLIRLPKNSACPSLDFVFDAQGFSYYKNEDMRELDLEIGDIHSNIVDTEIEILQTIREEVLDAKAEILFFSDLCAELDCIMSFATTAIDYREHTEETFIENDIMMGSYNGKVYPKAIGITGPNASGKSVLLQQVALLVYMAHLGSFVPCASAIIGTTDAILTRIRTKSLISRGDSTFLYDLKQAAAAVSQATSRSLVLVDEFGKGTIPTDGIGLFSALVLYLVKEKHCFLLAATHFQEQFDFPLFKDPEVTDALRFYQLDIYAVEGDPNPVFLYRLVEGRNVGSLGIVCASNAGIPSSIIQRALDIASSLNKGDPIPHLTMNEKALQHAKKVAAVFVEFDFEKRALNEFTQFLTKYFCNKEMQGSEHEQELEVSLHKTIQAICLSKKISISSELQMSLSHLVYHQTKIFASEVEIFARHAGRKIVRVPDVELLWRKRKPVEK